MARTTRRDRRTFLGTAAMTLAAAGLGSLGCDAMAADRSRQLTALGDATTWLQSPPLTADRLLGTPVLIQFGTYTCINWLRTLPHVRAWQRRYAPGLLVIGVHTPEFAFEQDLDNVRRAMQRLGVGFPMVLDNDRAIWRAFDNHYWPALYLLDGRGRVRYHHFGEGEYATSQRAIERMLSASGVPVAPGDTAGSSPDVATDIERPADWQNLRSPEIYLGHERSVGFASPGGSARGRRRTYTAPARLDLNRWALDGEWTVDDDHVTVLGHPPGRILCRFHARDVHLVMGPARRGDRVRFRVSIDGRPPGDARGMDVDEHGVGLAEDQRLHQLVRQPGPIVERTCEIAFLDPGVEAFSFTFG